MCTFKGLRLLCHYCTSHISHVKLSLTHYIIPVDKLTNYKDFKQHPISLIWPFNTCHLRLIKKQIVISSIQPPSHLTLLYLEDSDYLKTLLCFAFNIVWQSKHFPTCWVNNIESVCAIVNHSSYHLFYVYLSHRKSYFILPFLFIKLTFWF